MGVSKSTFYRDIEELIREGIVKKTSEGYSISKILFPVFSNKKVEEFKEQLDLFAEEDKDFKETRIYKTFTKYYNNDFKGLSVSPSRFIDLLISGLFFKKGQGVESKKIDKEYRF